MSSETSHAMKYEHNKQFYTSGINEKDKFIDWAITSVFYSTVHLIEMRLAKENKHSRDHGQRENSIRNDPELRKFLKEYKHLYQQSLIARYDCMIPKNIDLQFCEQDLFLIERQLVKK